MGVSQENKEWLVGETYKSYSNKFVEFRTLPLLNHNKIDTVDLGYTENFLLINASYCRKLSL